MKTTSYTVTNKTTGVSVGTSLKQAATMLAMLGYTQKAANEMVRHGHTFETRVSRYTPVVK